MHPSLPSLESVNLIRGTKLYALLNLLQENVNLLSVIVMTCRNVIVNQFDLFCEQVKLYSTTCENWYSCRICWSSFFFFSFAFAF